MSGATIIWNKLKSNANLIAVVPATKIRPEGIKLNTVLPAIGVTNLPGSHWKQIREDGSPKFRTNRVQVTIAAKTILSRKQALELVQDAVISSYGLIGGVFCNSVVEDNQGPEFNDEEKEIYTTSQDFIVSYTR